jgi:hypothetical protein
VAEPVLEKVAAGEPGAVDECLSRYAGLVWALAQRFSPNPSDAEDAVQEVFTEPAAVTRLSPNSMTGRSNVNAELKPNSVTINKLQLIIVE